MMIFEKMMPKRYFEEVMIHRHSNVHSSSPWRLVWQENSPNVTNWGSLPLWPLRVLEVLLFLPTSATKNHNLVLYVAPTVKYNGALTMYTPMEYLRNSSWPLVWMDFILIPILLHSITVSLISSKQPGVNWSLFLWMDDSGWSYLCDLKLPFQ